MALISHHRLRETDYVGGVFLDKGSQGANGTPANAPTFITDHAGRENGAWVGNGTTDYIDLGSVGGIANNWTIAGRFYSTSVAGEDIFFRWGTGVGINKIYIRLRGTKIEIVIFGVTGAASYKQYRGATTIQDATWYHTALTWDGTNLEIYLNGLADTPYSKLVDQAVMQTDTTRVRYIGTYLPSNGFWAGYLCDWRVYTTVFTPAEVLQLKTVTDEYYQVSIAGEIDFTGTLSAQNPNWLLIPDYLNWMGEWNALTSYSDRDVVLYKTDDGEFHGFVSKTNHNVGNIPTTSYQNWTRLIQGVWSR